jgi:chorismate-pyruvate lyase
LAHSAPAYDTLVGGPDAGPLFPLDSTYAQAGLDPPVARIISAAEVPAACAALLVHDNEMTRTLECHFAGSMSLRISWSRLDEPWFTRRVLLIHQASQRVVEIGAICLRLDAFDVPTRARIESGSAPLGRILREAMIAYTSEGRAYFATTPNADMLRAFSLSEPTTLYGRRRTIVLHGEKIGDVAEVLPPL